MAVAARPQETSGGRSIESTEKKPGIDVASRTDTATATLAAFAVEDAIQIDAQLNVTAASGTTPTLNVKLQTTMDPTGAAGWYDVQAFPQQTAAGTVSQSFGGTLGIMGRWVATIAGTTPSFTWNVDTQVRRVD